ncbi:hypothetical protein JCM8097_008250 [Rhodosporidiobolus ruineniae]
MVREKRKATLKQVKYAEDRPDSEEDEFHEVGDEQEVERNRRRRSKKDGEGAWEACKQGKLEAFQALPLDVLCEIARYLDPLTLLYMSRANKMLHGLLASRSAAPIWQIARNSVDLPAVEATDLNEMQLASLVYGRNCVICGRGRASIVDYGIRMRWCKTLKQAKHIIREFDFLDSKAIELSFGTTHGPTGRYWQQKVYYSKVHVEETSNSLDELKQAISSAQGKENRAKASSELDTWINERKANLKLAKTDAEKIRKWDQSDADTRRESADAKREARRKAIEQRLFDLGYHQQDFVLPSSIKLPVRVCPDSENAHSVRYLHSARNLVNQSTALTDQIWARIKDSVVESAEANREVRLACEAGERRQDRRNALRPEYDDLLRQRKGSTDVFGPSLNLFVHLPAVMPFWLDEDAVVDPEKWNEAKPAIEQDLVTASHVVKLTYARDAARAFAASGVEVDADVVKKLQAGENSNRADSPASGSTEYEQGQSDLYMTNTAPDVTDDELDSLLDRLTALVRCEYYSCSTVAPYESFISHLSTHDGVDNDAMGAFYSWFITLLLDLLAETKLEDNLSTFAILDGLGPVFDCNGCAASLDMSSRSFGAWYLYSSAPRPATSSQLTFTEICQHMFQYHQSAFSRLAVSRDQPVPKFALLPAGHEKLDELVRAGTVKLAEKKRDEVAGTSAAGAGGSGGRAETVAGEAVPAKVGDATEEGDASVSGEVQPMETDA